MTKTSLNIALDPDQVQWLREEAVRRRTSVAAVVRALIEASRPVAVGGLAQTVRFLDGDLRGLAVRSQT